MNPNVWENFDMKQPKKGQTMVNALQGAWLAREFTGRKVRGSNPTSAHRLPLCGLWQPGSIQALVLHSSDLTAERLK
ncbi:hypothetical protein T265_08293 [Opisthorchis viverrini]|uniref:Uncharacterized protein n=1 Tax=Opisthorchis viverrini TaxID=6198 RepID=A0A074Z9M1_OPIVI|nr:hypothetical protein T265_08293 [Opisthorchis viverrini]KER23931.1 hypothetical protein T265_08293 [Opisthorchis viverrini]